jgi:ornithine decarboxylase
VALIHDTEAARAVGHPWPERLEPAALDGLRHPTPYLICDLATVRDRVRQLRAALPGVRCHYAMKCNPAPQVLLAVADEGASFEIASLGELDRLRALGIGAADLLYSNPVKPPAHIEATWARGVRRFAFDGPGELRKLAALAPGSDVYLRVRVDDSASAFPLSRKFGAEPDEACGLLLRARQLGLRPYGLTFHVGSQCSDPDAWGRAIDRCGDVLRQLAVHGVRLEMLDLGGGLPARYSSGAASLDAIAGSIGRAIERSLPYEPPVLVVEPGRFLVAESGVLATTVLGRERRGAERWLYVDVSAYHGLMEAQQAGGSWDYPVRTTAVPVDGAEPAELVPFTVTGPTCDSSDTVFDRVLLPSSTDVGDRLYIGSAGAYTTAYGTSFNGFPPPATHVVDGG